MRGCYGVDLFFVLSGFIISYAYSAREIRSNMADYRRFIWFRFARIYPNHLATLMLLVALVLGSHVFHYSVPYENYPWSGLPAQLTMTHVWPFAYGGRWNLPSWSISAEWFAYLAVFPVCQLLLNRGWSTARLLAVAYLVFGGYCVFRPFLLWLPFDRPTALPNVAAEFIAGSMLYGVYRAGSPFLHFLQKHATALFILILAVAALAPGQNPWIDRLVILTFPLLLASLSSEESLAGKMFSSALWVWLGNISYAIYMSHSFAAQFFRFVAPEEKYLHAPLSMRLVLVAAHLAAVIAIAAALYYAVEVPCRNWMRRLFIARQKHTEARPLEPTGSR